MKKIILSLLTISTFTLNVFADGPPTFITSTNIPTLFFDTFGFSLSGIATFLTVDLIKPFIGMAFLIIKGILPWIIALVTIGAMLYFTYKAFTLYKKY
jgi:hypothetical protein